MPFCPNCGNQYEGSPNFCENCGQRLSTGNGQTAPTTRSTAATQAVPRANSAARTHQPPQQPQPERTIWTGRATQKGVPLAVEYELTTRRFIYRGGLIGRKEEQIQLYRIRDIKVKQSISDRALGIGNVVLISMDPSTPEYTIRASETSTRLQTWFVSTSRKNATAAACG